jgi:hypothetical protein
MEFCHDALKVSGLFVVLMVVFIGAAGVILWWIAGK